MKSRTVIIFGVFDGIHDGHREFIKEAKAQGEHLVAIVARDSMVEKLKGKIPIYTEASRIESLLQVPEIDRVLLGDLDEGSYNTLKEVNPSLLFLGYDQASLLSNIKKAIKKEIIKNVEIKIGTPYKPDTHHSSLLNTKSI